MIDLGGLLLIGVLAMWGAKIGVLSFPWQRWKSVNLVAARGEAASRPTTWLCAHIDSKSQTIPMLLRVASTVFFAASSALVAGSILVLLVLTVCDDPGRFSNAMSAFATGTTISSWLAVVTALPLIFCFIRNRSRGALDNATGIASIILAAEKIDPSKNVGVIITSGEELGLAGARYYAATASSVGTAINCDTIDDNGSFYCMASGKRIQRLDDAIGRASNGSLHIRPMIPGIIADNVAFTAKGWESFTLSRGNIGTLGYVHTSGDMPDRLKGIGIAQASSLIVAIVEELA